MAEAAYQKFYQLDSWSTTRSDFKMVFASALTTIKINSLIFFLKVFLAMHWQWETTALSRS